uniref:Uncharacterized protein n=1 Tax=Physcomitrium patens TaxID=3218 RepID=A0A2K1IY82_PHYPA|nr:hypothetical protein PHYPA_024057 [Physcomitrium patens]
MELQGEIQLKTEELKVFQDKRDMAIAVKRSQLEWQCDRITLMETELRKNLQELLKELQSLQEEWDRETSQLSPLGSSF